jgi:hypothetical protein
MKNLSGNEKIINFAARNKNLESKHKIKRQ